MPKTKKKPVKKTKAPKTKTKKRTPAPRAKKNKKESFNTDVIFDSRVGKTDALFVDNPDQKPAVQLDPAINEALKEFDTLPEVQPENKTAASAPVLPEAGQEIKLDLNNLNNPNKMENQQKIVEKKKGFSWKNLFSLKNKFFSIFAGLIFAGVFCGAAYIYAQPPARQYNPGEATNPGCAPTDTNCSVVAPAVYSFGSNNFSGTGSVTAGNITDSGLTSGRIPFSGTAGLLGDNANLTYNGNTLSATSTSAAQLNLINGSGNTSFTINSDGSLSMASSNATGGNQILSNGKLVLGGTGNTNNENLRLDFESSANTVGFDSTTGVTSLNFGGMGLTTTGTGVFSGGVQTSYSTTAPSGSCTNGQTEVVWPGGSGTAYELYFCDAGAWRYAINTGGFQIPGSETVDPVSGSKIGIGDFVLGMVNQNEGDNPDPAQSSLHGVWVKWDSVKQQLLQELQQTQLTPSGTVGTGAVVGVAAVQNALTNFGFTFDHGANTIKEILAGQFTAKTVSVERFEMLDAANRDVYCMWINNGDLVKTKGDCATVGPDSSPDDIAADFSRLNATVAQQAQTQSTTSVSATDLNNLLDQIAALKTQVVSLNTTVTQLSQSQQPAAATTTPTTTTTTSPTTTPPATTTTTPATTAAPVALNISTVAPIADINVDYGTALVSVNLPMTVSVTLSDGSMQSLTITWDNGTPTYDPNTAGTYVFFGTLTLPGTVTNTQNIKATVNVIVAQQSTAAVSPTAETGTMIQNAASDLSNGIRGFVEWIFDMFGTGTKTVSSTPAIQGAGADLANGGAGLVRDWSSFGVSAASGLNSFVNASTIVTQSAALGLTQDWSSFGSRVAVGANYSGSELAQPLVNLVNLLNR